MGTSGVEENPAPLLLHAKPQKARPECGEFSAYFVLVRNTGPNRNDRAIAPASVDDRGKQS
jgi:hypothetical protein